MCKFISSASLFVGNIWTCENAKVSLFGVSSKQLKTTNSFKFIATFPSLFVYYEIKWSYNFTICSN